MRWRLSGLAVALALLAHLDGHAALFGDDEARAAILELRQRVETQRQQADSAQTRLQEDNAQLRRGLLDLQNQIEVLRAEIARLRGTHEQLARDISEGQRRERDGQQAVMQRWQSLDDRLRVLEPRKVTVDGREIVVTPTEKQEFDAALAVFRAGDFAAAQAQLLAFLRRYPASGFGPSALFWLGNAQYATRDYKEAIINFRALIAQAPDHLRVPESQLSIANCQVELKDVRAARRTLEDVVRLYPTSEAAQTARERLSRLR
jgi:tol-pal system protein YbgF